MIMNERCLLLNMATPYKTLIISEEAYIRLRKVPDIMAWWNVRKIRAYWERGYSDGTPARIRLHFDNDNTKTLFIMTFSEYL
jgi:hypothetical protein